MKTVTLQRELYTTPEISILSMEIESQLLQVSIKPWEDDNDPI